VLGSDHLGVGAALTALGVGAYRYLHDGEEKR
jgi:hypothetical protein